MLHAADVEALGAIKKQVSRCWLLYVFSAAGRYMYYMYEFNTYIYPWIVFSYSLKNSILNFQLSKKLE